MQTDPEAPARPPATRRSPWRTAALAALAVVVLAWPVAWIVGSRVARAVLVREVERLFDARVDVGTVQFLPPFWLVVSDLALSSDVGGERIDWLRAADVRATLLGWPDGGLPPLRLAVDGPVLTLVRTPDGVIDVLDRRRGDAAGADAGGGANAGAEGDGAAVAAAARLPVRALDLASARLVILDRTVPGVTPPPRAVGGFDVAAREAGEGRIDVTVAGGDAHLRLDGRGAVDVATGIVTVGALDAHLKIGGAATGTAVDVDVTRFAGSVDPGTRSARIDDASVTVAGEPPIVADGVRATLALSDGRLDASEVAARVAGGSVDGTFMLRWDEAPSWQASGRASDLRLADLARRFPHLGGEGVQGVLSARGSFSGDLAAGESAWLASLVGSGSMRAREGRFFTIPLVSQLLEQAGLSDAGATLTDASAEFRVADRAVNFAQVAIGSTAVGVQGHGEVGFDGRVQLDMVVMPFGSWRSAVERGGVPVVGDVLAKLAGKAQELVGKASGALYAFRITGTVQEPRLTPVPVPSLTGAAKNVFESMASGSWTKD